METIAPQMLAMIVAGLVLVAVGGITLMMGRVFSWIVEWLFDMLLEQMPR